MKRNVTGNSFPDRDCAKRMQSNESFVGYASRTSKILKILSYINSLSRIWNIINR